MSGQLIVPMLIAFWAGFAFGLYQPKPDVQISQIGECSLSELCNEEWNYCNMPYPLCESYLNSEAARRSTP
jgi:hypothetical protein